MTKIYYYLLFRIYRFYADVMKERDMPLFYTSAVSTVFLFFNLISIYFLLENSGFISYGLNKYIILFSLCLLWMLNHFLIVKNEFFLKMNYAKKPLGGWLVILYIIFTIIFSIVEVNKHREKLLNEKRFDDTEYIKRKPSLEGKIIKWFNEL